MALRIPELYPDILALIAETVDAQLRRSGISVDCSGEAAIEAAEAVRQAVGGAQIYISMGMRWVANERNSRIIESLSKLKGSDPLRYATVASQFKLSERWVRILEKGWIEEERARRQNVLFEDSG